MAKMSTNRQLIEKLAEEADVKPAKVERVLATLEKYIGDPNFPEECTYTFAHTRDWCGNPLCREQ